MAYKPGTKPVWGTIKRSKLPKAEKSPALGRPTLPKAEPKGQKKSPHISRPTLPKAEPKGQKKSRPKLPIR